MSASDLVEVNGALVDRRYIYATIAWDVATLITWAFTIVGCRRAYFSYKRSNGRLKDYPVYWSHLGVNAVLLTIVAVDPAGIVFDFWNTINLVCLLEIAIGNYGSVIYTFVNTVQHYIVQQKLVAPPWVAKFKRRFLWFNFITSNIFIIIQVAIDRIYVSGLATCYFVLQGAVIGPVFAVLVRRLTMRLEAQFAARSSVESIQSENRETILKGVRKFRRFAYITTFLIYAFLLLMWMVYIPRFFLPKDLVHSNSEEYPNFARTRRFKMTFELNWVIWVSPFVNSYLMYRHWISKSSFAGSLATSGNKSDGSTDSNTSASGDPFYRSREGTINTPSVTKMKQGSTPMQRLANSPPTPRGGNFAATPRSVWSQPPTPGQGRKLSTVSSHASVWAQPARQVWAQPAHPATQMTSIAVQQSVPVPPAYSKPVADASFATPTNGESPWSSATTPPAAGGSTWSATTARAFTVGGARGRSTSLPRHNVGGVRGRSTSLPRHNGTTMPGGRSPRTMSGGRSPRSRRAADVAENMWTMNTVDRPYEA